MYLLGLDVGTTGCKSILFSPDGAIVSSAYGEYRLHHRRPDWSELDPEEVWRAVVATVRASVRGKGVDPRLISAVSMAVLGEAFLPVDRDGNWLHWSMTTFDARAVEETRWLEENLGAGEVYQVTGQPLTAAMPIYTLPKIMWLRENEPGVYGRASKFLCWEDYVNMRLCGRPVIDYSVATRTMLFDIRRKRWSRKILDAVGLDEGLLPEVSPSGRVVGEVTREAAAELGLAEGTPVVTGGHDQPCGALGAGVVEAGPAMDATGTTLCLGVLQPGLTLTEGMRLDGYAVHCYVTEDRYFMFGFNPSGGVALRWFRDTLAQREKEDAQKSGVDVYDLLTREAAEAQAGSTELFHLPYFEGSGNPTFNRRARGAFIGLTLAHGRREVIRSILEGVTYELRRIIESIEGHGVPLTELRAIGGGARSRLWLQIKANVTGKRVAAPSVTEAAALGAAILAGVGAGTYGNAEEAVRRVYREREAFTPEKEPAELYDRYYRVYKGLYDALRGAFDEMEALKDFRESLGET